MDDHSPDEFLEAHRSRKRVMIAIALAGAALVLGGAIFVILSMKPTPSKEADAGVAPRVAELDHMAIETARQEAITELGPACEEDRANAVLKRLAKASDWDGVVIVGKAWEGRCPPDELVRWKLFKALEELERWPDAVAVATQLIAMNPTDVDYWWWRGKARKRAGDVPASAADYRQSIALSELESSSGVHVMGFADVAPSVGQACEAAFAIRWYGHRNGGEVNDSGLRKLASVATFGKCQGAGGRGQATVTLADPQDLAIEAARLEAKIDLHVPYVVIDEATAATAGLDLGKAQAIELVLDGEVRPARLLRVAEVRVNEELSVGDIDVAIVDQLLTGAVIGLGYWWRFDWAPSSMQFSAEVSEITDAAEL